MTLRVLVTGATGNQGGATARQLLSLNAQVHAPVRDVSSIAALGLQKLGAKLFEGDFDNTNLPVCCSSELYRGLPQRLAILAGAGI